MSAFPMPKIITPDTFRVFLRNYCTWKKSQNLSKGCEVEFDFRNCQFVSPVGIVFLSAEADSMKENGIRITARVNSGKFISFMADMGIFKSRKDIEVLLNRDGLVPVHKCFDSDEGMAAVKQITPLIKKASNCKNSTAASLDWGIWEILDNAGCHGYKCYDTKIYPKPVYVSATFRDKYVEVAVLDKGQGIFSSLTPKYPDFTPRKSLEECIKKGISGHPVKSPGFGLYGTSELARRGGGQFYIWSSGYGLSITQQGAKTHADIPIAGTIVSFGFNSKMETPFEQMFKQPPEEYFEDLMIGEEQ